MLLMLRALRRRKDDGVPAFEKTLNDVPEVSRAAERVDEEDDLHAAGVCGGSG